MLAAAVSPARKVWATSYRVLPQRATELQAGAGKPQGGNNDVLVEVAFVAVAGGVAVAGAAFCRVSANFRLLARSLAGKRKKRIWAHSRRSNRGLVSWQANDAAADRKA